MQKTQSSQKFQKMKNKLESVYHLISRLTLKATVIETVWN